MLAALRAPEVLSIVLAQKKPPKWKTGSGEGPSSEAGGQQQPLWDYTAWPTVSGSMVLLIC